MLSAMGSRHTGVVGAIVLAAMVGFVSGAPRAYAEETLEDGLHRCRALVLEEEWVQAEQAMRALLTQHDGNLMAHGHIDEIEETLRLCMFRQEHGLPEPEQIFGSAIKRFDRHSRKVTLEFKSPTGVGWEKTADFHLYDVRFDGSFTLTFSGSQMRVFGVLLCYDVENQGGYVVTSGSAMEGYETTRAELLRVGGVGGKEVLRSKTPPRTSGTTAEFVVNRQAGQISVKRNGKSLFKTRDNRYSSGYFGVIGDVYGITLKGRIDRHWMRGRVGDLLAANYAKWMETNWDREKELPGWLARGPAALQHEPLTQWPSDVPLGRRKELNRALNFFLDEKPLQFVMAAAALKKLPERTWLWIRGLAELTALRYRAAEHSLSQLIELEPEFRPALVFRGMARRGLRDRDGALADFAAAEDGASQYPHLYAGRAFVYLFEDDADAAYAVLADATAKGVLGPVIDDLRGWVHRARRGPQWTERFQHETEHFVVMSDHGKKLCFEVGTALERARRQYAKPFGEVPEGARKARVFVFAGREGYLHYAGDLALDLSWTSGVYIPVLRELLIWVPMDRNDLDHTVRHEGFHQYLHNFVEDAPLWFNEGWAENFGRTRGEQRRADPVAWRKYRDAVVPLRELLRMNRMAFLGNAALHYPQSDDVVRFLRETKNKKLSPLLPAYFAALVDGQSIDEAYDSVFAPHIDTLQAWFDDYINNGGR